MDVSLTVPLYPEENKSIPFLKLTVLQTEDELDQMEPLWKDLVDKSNATVFQTFEWVRTWWKYFGGKHELCCIVCMDTDTLVGILPAFLERKTLLGLRVSTTMKFVGSGISDYLEPIVLPDYEDAFVQSIVKYLINERGKWDVFEITDVSETSPISKNLMERLGQSGLNVFSYEGSLTSEVRLSPTWEDHLQQLGRHTRHELKRKTQKLKENVEFEVEEFGRNSNDVKMAMKAVASLHGERWKSLGYGNAFDDEKQLAFHTEVAEKFAARGWLRIFFLKINGIRVALNQGFLFRKRVYVYVANAHAPEEIMKYSPGYVLHYLVMRHAIEEGAEVYDMLRGMQTYKATDFKAVQTGNRLMRAVSAYQSKMLRFRLFVAMEILGKVPRRLNDEYHEFKRYVITQDPSFSSMLKFISKKFLRLWNVGRSYLTGFFSDSKPPTEE
jgi:CelD/BcsL family acetyltransferase involved in cellulose biosynthesis